MGFAVYRIDSTGKETALPSHAVFTGYTIKPGQTTAEFPIQKFYWKDPYARLIAERTRKRDFQYKVVPLTGKAGDLRPMTNLPHVITNQVTVSPAMGDGIEVYFNRGLISTQRVSRALKKAGAQILRRRREHQGGAAQVLAGGCAADLRPEEAT